MKVCEETTYTYNQPPIWMPRQPHPPHPQSTLGTTNRCGRSPWAGDRPCKRRRRDVGLKQQQQQETTSPQSIFYLRVYLSVWGLTFFFQLHVGFLWCILLSESCIYVLTKRVGMAPTSLLPYNIPSPLRTCSEPTETKGKCAISSDSLIEDEIWKETMLKRPLLYTQGPS